MCSTPRNSANGRRRSATAAPYQPVFSAGSGNAYAGGEPGRDLPRRRRRAPREPANVWQSLQRQISTTFSL